jgi:YgiT-type zinc finger domain-containing protein
MNCLKCFKGELENGITSLTYVQESSAVQVKVEEIPAEICSACGEVFLSEAVAQQLYNLVTPLLDLGESRVYRYE